MLCQASKTHAVKKKTCLITVVNKIWFAGICVQKLQVVYSVNTVIYNDKQAHNASKISPEV